jgi:hypothetical protein
VGSLIITLNIFSRRVHNTQSAVPFRKGHRAANSPGTGGLGFGEPALSRAGQTVSRHPHKVQNRVQFPGPLLTEHGATGTAQGSYMPKVVGSNPTAPNHF